MTGPWRHGKVLMSDRPPFKHPPDKPVFLPFQSPDSARRNAEPTARMRLAARLFSTPTGEGDHSASLRDGPSGQHGSAPNDKPIWHLPCPPLVPSPSPSLVPLCLPVVRFFLRFALG